MHACMHLPWINQEAAPTVPAQVIYIYIYFPGTNNYQTDEVKSDVH